MRYPEWVPQRTKYYLSEDEKDRYYKPELNPRSCRGGVYANPGYNPSHDSIQIERMILDVDDIEVLPY